MRISSQFCTSATAAPWHFSHTLARPTDPCDGSLEAMNKLQHDQPGEPGSGLACCVTRLTVRDIIFRQCQRGCSHVLSPSLSQEARQRRSCKQPIRHQSNSTFSVSFGTRCVNTKTLVISSGSPLTGDKSQFIFRKIQKDGL